MSRGPEIPAGGGAIGRARTRVWPRHPSLRLKLTLLYGALLAMLIAAFGVVLYLETRSLLIESTATRLRAQVKPIVDGWRENGAGETDDFGGYLTATAPQFARSLTSADTAALVLDATGRPLADGRRLPEEPLPAEPDPAAIARALGGENEVSYRTAVADEAALVVLIPLRDPNDHDRIFGVVQLSSTSLQAVDDVLWRERWLIGGGALLALLLGALGGLWLTTSALAPLRRLAATCRRVAAGDLGQRVNLPDRRDEIGQVAEAFDDMAERIERAFADQRRFVADAAHELRTPLTALAGSLDVLLRGAQDDPAVAAQLTRGMRREVQRLARLAEQLLDLDRLGGLASLARTDGTDGATGRLPVRLRSLDLDGFVAGFAEQARLLAPERTVLVETGPAARLVVDPDRLEQALVNLVDNAAQHTTLGGTIRLGWDAGDDTVAIWVADDGEGIAAADLPHVFAPFYRGDRSRSRRRGGTGLGLAIVGAVVQAHGGAVAVDSRPGAGARFTLTFPARGSAATQSGIAASAASDRPTERFTYGSNPAAGSVSEAPSAVAAGTDARVGER